MSAVSINYETAWLLGETARRGHVHAVLEHLRSAYTIAGKDVLELGSGIGNNLLIFKDGNRVLGIEGMAQAAALAQQKGIETVCADLEGPLPLPTASTDWVLCIDVLEHLRDPKACLLEALRVLRHQGHVVINLPNHFDWRGRLRILAGSGIDSQNYFPDRPGWDYPHLRFFTKGDLASLLGACGLEVAQDLSSRTSSIPKAAWFARAGLGAPIQALSRLAPNLLQAGFFVVCRRAAAARPGQPGPAGAGP